MSTTRTYTVKEVARITHLSVRALHHYDDIGLLVPARSENGYRRYAAPDMLRLQQILIHRSFGLSLEAIGKILDAPDFDPQTALKHQRQKLVDRLSDTHRMIASIDAALQTFATKVPTSMTDLKQIFDGFDPADYKEEATETWGDTDAFRESARRTKNYGDEEWRSIKHELDGIWTDAAALMQSGTTPTSSEALSIAERHRQHIDRWFYPLDESGHVQLASMWESDPRFKANIDKYADGLTCWTAAAIRAALPAP